MHRVLHICVWCFSLVLYLSGSITPLRFRSNLVTLLVRFSGFERNDRLEKKFCKQIKMFDEKIKPFAQKSEHQMTVKENQRTSCSGALNNGVLLATHFLYLNALKTVLTEVILFNDNI